MPASVVVVCELFAFSREAEIADDRYGIMIRFSEINIDTPTFCRLAENGLRTCVMYTLEPKHKVSNYREFLQVSQPSMCLMKASRDRANP
jgi:hypothetical protein